MTTAQRTRVSPAELDAYRRDGFHVARGLFGRDEMDQARAFFDGVAERGEPIPGAWEPKHGGDPLGRYPRMMHPHTVDPASHARMLDPRVRAVLRQLLGEDALACQSMFYFKPPGARGQAFHQDNFYLRVKPATCIAAWWAVDPSTPENGGLQLCPGTQDMDVVCPDEADAAESFTREYVAPPPGHDPVKLWLDSGDVLFFTGGVVHGSQPNTTRDQWRRSFICHYMPVSATHVSTWYLPYLQDFDGAPRSRAENGDGGPCGDDRPN